MITNTNIFNIFKILHKKRLRVRIVVEYADTQSDQISSQKRKSLQNQCMLFTKGQLECFQQKKTEFKSLVTLHLK